METRSKWLRVGGALALALTTALPLMAQTVGRDTVPERHRFAGGEATVAPPGPEGYDRVLDPAAVNVPPGYQVEVFARGLVYPTDITFGPNGEAYVSEAGGHFYGSTPKEAPPSRILRIWPDGRTEVVYDNAVPFEAIRDADVERDIPEGLIGPMEGITYNPHNGLIYIAHRSRYSVLNPETGEFRTLLGGLPAWGIFHNTKPIIAPNGDIVFGISSQGNLGIVDLAFANTVAFYNKPLKRDVPCETVVLTGRDFTVENVFTDEKGDTVLTGAFVPFGVQTDSGQVLEGELICNSSLYRTDPEFKEIRRLAWGIRNAFHYDFGPDGELYFTNNSCNPIPGRPVYDDWETLYRLEQGAWYGWPDYCSSVPVTDDRFRAPDDPQFKGGFHHEFVLTPETHRRLLKGQPTPPPPTMRFRPHVAAQGFVFGKPVFGVPEDHILLAEFGAVIPYEVAKGAEQGGFRVSLVDYKNNQTKPFMWNKSGQPASAAKGQPAPQGGGLERPLRMEWGPDGALYVVDFGVFDVHPKPKDAPKKQSFPRTGVIWKVTYTGDQPMERTRIPVRKGGR